MDVYDIARCSLVIKLLYLRLISIPQKPERGINIYSNPKMTIGVTEANALVYKRFIR